MASSATRESEEQLQAIISSATDAIITIDEEHRITLFNGGAETIFRCAAKDVLGKPLERFIPPRYRERHPDFIREFGKAEITARAMGRERVLVALRATGEEFPMEARISQSSIGGRKLYTVILRDVTERLLAAEALRDSEGRFKAIIASATDAIVTIDEEQRITLFNGGAEAIFGYRANEILGRPLDLLLPERFRAVHTAHINEFGQAGTATRTMGKERILVGLRRNGEEFPIEAQISQVVVRGAKLYTVIIRDVTDRINAQREREQLLVREREARAEAEAANRAKDQFLSTVSHELRTPLTAMLGWVRLLREGRVTGEQVGKALEVIERSGKSQIKLINDLLDLSRIVTGRLRLDLRRVDMATVVVAAVETLRPMAEQKQVRVDVRLDAVPPMVVGDAERLQQVVWNLVNNAVKFTPEGGEVDVGLAGAADEMVLTVRDDGAGIAAEFLPRVFEPFQQAVVVQSRGEKAGLGLGLSIVQHLVELHRGSVQAASEGPGTGSTFTVRLPRGDATRVQPVTEVVEPVDEGCLGGLHVLVVEDDIHTRELLGVILESYGATVATAATVAEARDMLSSEPPDILLSDIRLPDGNGYQLAQGLRAARSMRNVPALAITGHGEEEEALALAAGFNLRLLKPVEPRALVAALAGFRRVDVGKKGGSP